ncbi:hypothetical protein DU43_16140 [Methanosarcina mazei]|uniref:Uncharacterized protein n=1 Tax=Methanosarcina mazei TaxID=2209 RepID=A0A0F8HDA4_METMZ|nr:PGF-pre-PGF domain-containing protein [Methanosarcina mazei]KKG74676.1 hypothetical protein DU43_16140 [Methanosarcina mazei]
MLIIFLLTVFLVLIHVPVALCMAAPVVYVDGNESGDFNCDGIDDHVQINQALKFVAENPEYTTVYLKGPFTYVVDSALLIDSNTILEGDSNATIKLTSSANWARSQPMIKENKSGSHDITIRGFTLDGNRKGNRNVVSGDGYYNFIHLSDCQNISVCDMYLTNNHGDGLKADRCSNVKFCNNNAYMLGHDVLYAILCSGVEAYDNIIICRTNSGLRLYNTNHARFYNNTITSESSGGAGIEIQKDGSDFAMDNIEIYANTIYNTALPGILVFGSGSYSNSSAYVHIHHNQIYDTGTDSNNKLIGGIVSEGFNGLIENNVIDGAYGNGIAQDKTYYHSPDGSGYVLTVRNNIISNIRSSASGIAGYGIRNQLPETHFFVLQNNSLYNNLGGDYAGVEASPWDIVADPQYADRDKHDYHLKSKAGRWNGSSWVIDNISSPCIDAGYSLSDYSNEPEPNGDRINIGPYGNTRYASKSEIDMSNNSSDDDNGNNGDEGDDEKNDKDNSGKSSGGGGGTGGSPETPRNIEVKELSQVFITNGKGVKFDFSKNVTCVLYIGFDSKKTTGKTTATVEMLKNKSVLVSSPPPENVYKYFNLWVGNSGYGTSDSIENPVICFRVNKTWIREEKIEQSSITLNRYNDEKWNPLLTSLSGEDGTYLYFTAETPGFSPFAITGRAAAKENVIDIMPEPDIEIPEQNNESKGPGIEVKPEQTENKVTPEKEKISMPGFELIYCIIGLLGVLCRRR